MPGLWCHMEIGTTERMGDALGSRQAGTMALPGRGLPTCTLGAQRNAGDSKTALPILQGGSRTFRSWGENTLELRATAHAPCDSNVTGDSMSRVGVLGPNPYTPVKLVLLSFHPGGQTGLSAAEKPFDAVRNRGAAGRHLQCHSPMGMPGSPAAAQRGRHGSCRHQGSRLGFRFGFPIGFLGSNPRGLTPSRGLSPTQAHCWVPP